MSVDPVMQNLRMMFAPWNSAAAANAFPASVTLAQALEKVSPPGSLTGAVDVHVDAGTAKYFATASIDIWHRAIHSLLISIVLTRQSSLWSIVSGYYATHYTFRGLAHLLGHFQLFRVKRMVHLRFENGSFICAFRRGHGREHDWYRKVVSSDIRFKSDPFFTSPAPSAMLDVEYRDRANYADHLSALLTMSAVDRAAVRNRMLQISRIEVQAPPELTIDSFPNVEAVQINAYHRVVRFRNFLDETLVNNRLWKVHRNPGWAAEFTDFMTLEARGPVQR
jgi:hypothetical protein